MYYSNIIDIIELEIIEVEDFFGGGGSMARNLLH